MKAVADASFLIGLCFINQLKLLEQMVEHIYVAPAVWREVVEQGQGKPGAQEIQQAKFIKEQQVQNNQTVEMLKIFLGAGEAESLVLAQELGCSVIFVDDLRARKAAQEAGFQTIGVAGFLLAAKQKGLLQEIRPLLELLQHRGFRLSDKLIKAVLNQAEEDSQE